MPTRRQSATAAGLTFVPGVFQTSQGTTWISWQDRYWDVTEWLPGQADFHQQPTQTRLEACCQALARLHLSSGVDCRLARLYALG